MADNASHLINARALSGGHAFSFSSQPYLGELFKAVSSDSAALTIVVGAGVSVNSGLPSWRELIDKLIDRIDDSTGDIRNMARAFDADAARKADLVLQLARRFDHNVREDELIRDSLYPKNSPAQAGSLAKAIARLVVTRSSTSYLVTTNFDVLLEDALTALTGSSGAIRSFGLDEYTDWKAWCEVSGNFGILHVHGIVRQGGDPTEPIILTQSQFLRHGAEVQGRIGDILKDSTGLFVGLSMTDPNLIGPLYLRASGGHALPLFSLTVAELDAGPSELRQQQAEFAVESVRFLNAQLGLSPILLKSYSQLDQVISDLALAVREPTRYKRRVVGGVDSLYYGRRSQKAIDRCHRAIGSAKSPFVPAGADAAALSTKLRDALTAPRGPQRLLRQLATEYGVKYPAGEQEAFGLYLWLRALDTEEGEPTYSLKLVGASAFQALDPWFIGRKVPIVRQTNYAAAQSVYTGNMVKANLDSGLNSGIWRGVFAVPIILTEESSTQSVNGDPLDRIIVGALTLDSTYYVDQATAPAASSPTNSRRGVLTVLNAEDQEKVRRSLAIAAAKVLQP